MGIVTIDWGMWGPYRPARAEEASPITPAPTVPPVGAQDHDEVDVEPVSLDDELRKALE